MIRIQLIHLYFHCKLTEYDPFANIITNVHRFKTFEIYFFFFFFPNYEKSFIWLTFLSFFSLITYIFLTRSRNIKEVLQQDGSIYQHLLHRHQLLSISRLGIILEPLLIFQSATAIIFYSTIIFQCSTASGGTLENNSSVENNNGGTLENNSSGTLENEQRLLFLRYPCCCKIIFNFCNLFQL